MHWIQSKKSNEDDWAFIKVTVTAVHDDGRVEFEGDGVKATMWHHDPDELRSAMRFGGRAEWQPSLHLLYVISVGFVQPGDRGSGGAVCPAGPPPAGGDHPAVHRRSPAGEPRLAVPEGDGEEPPAGFLVGVDKPSDESTALMRKLSEELGGTAPSGAGHADEPREEGSP